MLNIVLFGPPGAGKGTQSQFLIDNYGLAHISTGDVFRYNMKNDTELGKLAKSYINKGALVPDEVTIDMLKAEFEKHKASKGVIFDGFPRTTAQAEALDSMLEEYGSSVKKMVALEVPIIELKDRLKKRAEIEGRADDQDDDKINNRIDVYMKETLPVAEYYEKQDKLSRVNGIGSIEEISERIRVELD
jgi:adenylate kinase